MKKQRGFTLVELIIVMGIILMLSGFATINLVKQQNTTSVNSSVDVLVSDIKSQQTKAMAGVKGDLSNNISFGIYFQSDRYVLFRGTTFSSTDSANFTVFFDENIAFSDIKFPNNTIVFQVRSGEVSGFAPGGNTLTIQNVSGLEKKTVTVNRYGVVININ